MQGVSGESRGNRRKAGSTPDLQAQMARAISRSRSVEDDEQSEPLVFPELPGERPGKERHAAVDDASAPRKPLGEGFNQSPLPLLIYWFVIPLLVIIGGVTLMGYMGW